jgi:hypothetical protein
MLADRIPRRPTPWFAIVGVWLGLGLFDALQTVVVMRSEGMHHAWLRLFAVTVASWLPWALATPLVLRLGRRLPPVGLRGVRTWPAHLAACLAIGAVFAAWKVGLEVLLDPYPDLHDSASFLDRWLDGLGNGMLSSLVLYAGVVTIGFVLNSRARLDSARTETAQLNEQLAKAQLVALQRQIEPHFLFNALNAVVGLVREGRSQAALETVVALSDLLRRMLDDAARHEVPLREELAFAQKYLDIQKMRFADRLRVNIDVPAELGEILVPYLVLQPLVENAVKHGIAKRVQGGTIRISARGGASTLALSVANDGPSLAARGEPVPGGIGISNVRSRLRGLYGDRFALRIANIAGGVEVELTLPCDGFAAIGARA